jgi:glyoxylase-like metal-dependent hydrolase (beta-lactamase superfamily II)
MASVQVIPFLVSEVLLPRDEQATLGQEWWPSYAHAVVHPDGVFLFDNGAGFGDPEIDATFTPRARPIEDCLAEQGLAIGDVTGIANCHLHWDHCGQNVRLPGGVPIFVQRAEWAMVHEPNYTIAAWVDAPHLSYEVLAGQAVQSRAEWEGGTDTTVSGQPGALDPAAYDRSVANLRSLDPVRVHFAHDAAIWHR